jgi:hypothetical protein
MQKGIIFIQWLTGAGTKKKHYIPFPAEKVNHYGLECRQ